MQVAHETLVDNVIRSTAFNLSLSLSLSFKKYHSWWHFLFRDEMLIYFLSRPVVTLIDESEVLMGKLSEVATRWID